MKKENELSTISNPLKILSEPGDSLSAYVTKTGRKVLKIKTNVIEYSATRYSNGTVVETKTTKKK